MQNLTSSHAWRTKRRKRDRHVFPTQVSSSCPQCASLGTAICHLAIVPNFKKKKTFILKINFNAELLLLLFKLLAQDSSHPEWWHLHTDRPPESFQLTCSAPAALGFLSLSLSSDTLMVHEVFRFLHSASRKGSLILGVHYLIICAVSFKKFYASLGKAGVWLLLWGE